MIKSLGQKIHIIGPVGSGKTTIAKKIALINQCNHFELDNIVWIRSENGDIRRSENERDSILQQIIENQKWVIEGAHYQMWTSPSLKSADSIIYLEPSYFTRMYRINKRFIKQLLKIEQANYNPTFKMLRKMFEWSKFHEKKGKHLIQETLNQYQDKVILIKSKKDLNRLLEEAIS
ncbi:DNA topology modulation protein FlaR [Rummeliibacillus sp. NPDC094406]|uniref:DNA topology modulation protein FlaR n=1 Tax=Rummeliibacillus sp. NPDC094406 TaxID=3364511 RepID=UPI003819E408